MDNGLIVKSKEAIQMLFGGIDPSITAEEKNAIQQQQLRRLWNWLRDGTIQGKKFGRDWYIPTKEITRFTDSFQKSLKE